MCLLCVKESIKAFSNGAIEKSREGFISGKQLQWLIWVTMVLHTRVCTQWPL